MNILNFYKGDIITRTEPIHYKDGQEDKSYIGVPVKLENVGKGLIFFEVIGQSVGQPKSRTLPTDLWGNGWEKYTIPEGVTMEDLEKRLV